MVQVPVAGAFQKAVERNCGELASQRAQRGPQQRLAVALCLENLLPVRHQAMRRSLPSARWRFASRGIFFVLGCRDSRLCHYKLTDFDQLEWIGVMCRREPGDLHVEFAFIQRERALQDSVAIGPATSPPCPEAPCTITATTYFGWSNGAKHANHATFSSCPRSVACAVPVFPATTRLSNVLCRRCRHLHSQPSKGLCEPARCAQGRFPVVNPIARAACGAARIAMLI